MNIQQKYDKEIINKNAFLLYDGINDKVILKRIKGMLPKYKLKLLIKRMYGNIKLRQIIILNEDEFKEYLNKVNKQHSTSIYYIKDNKLKK